MTTKPVSLESLAATSLALTEDGYDNIKSEFSQTCINSLSPGSWLADSCISGGVWGPQTEAAQSASAIRDFYQFGPRQRTLRFPVHGPRNQDGKQVFLEVVTSDTRSLVFSVADLTVGANAHTFTPGEKRASHKSRRQAGGNLVTDKHVHYAYELVSDEELDSVYASFLDGQSGTTAEQVWEKVTHSVLRKLAVGILEHDLRKRGLTDLVGLFWLKMKPAIEGKRFQPKGGGRFSWYVNRCWANHRADRYRELSVLDNKFESSDSSHREETERQIGSEDRFAVQTNDSPAQRDALDAQRIVGSVSLTGTQQAIADLLMNGMSQKDTAEQVDMSRHQVARVQAQIKKKFLRRTVAAPKSTVA